MQDILETVRGSFISDPEGLDTIIHLRGGFNDFLALNIRTEDEYYYLSRLGRYLKIHLEEKHNPQVNEITELIDILDTYCKRKRWPDELT